MIDLNAIKHRHLDPERMKGRTYYAGHLELDLAALVEEVERLRAEVERERAAVAESERNRSAIEEWAHRYGEALCPRSGDADSFGDGMRAAKQQVLTLLRGTP